MMYAMRSMIAEFMRDKDRSESGGAGGSAPVEEIPAEAGTTPRESPEGAVPTAVRGTAAGGGTICVMVLRVI